MRPRRAPPPPPPPGPGPREGGAPRRAGAERAAASRRGLGRPRLCTCRTSPPRPALPASAAPLGLAGPALRGAAAGASEAGGARGPSSLGPRPGRPWCPHFLPLCGPKRSGTAPAPLRNPELGPTDPFPSACRSLIPGQDNGEHRAFAYRVSLACKNGVPGGRGLGPTAGHPRGSQSRAPCPGGPQGPAIASLPRAALGSFASKTKTNPIPPPCLPEEGGRARRGG